MSSNSNKYFYSNCFFEMIKAKIKNPKVKGCIMQMIEKKYYS